MTAPTTSCSLTGERIHLAEGHFSEGSSRILGMMIQEFGAVMAEDRREASIVIINPSSSAMKTEKDRIAALAKSEHNFTPIHVSYQWLSLCQIRSTRVDISSISKAKLAFVKDEQPLRAWVSVNIIRRTTETSQSAYAAVLDLLVRGGALIVYKRAQAELLVVDPQTTFYHTVISEKEKFGRHYQKLVERDWVEDYFQSKQVSSWRTGNSRAKVDSGDESFGEEEMPPKKGPGRPAGQTRKDYTLEEDDFLVRYLAAHFSHGSWGSIKTYRIMVSQKDKYPIAASHSEQSWLERYKKNSTAFAKRVNALIAQGVDDTLKTRDEREKERARRGRGGSAAAGATRGAQPAAASGSNTSAISGHNSSKQSEKKKTGAKKVVLESDGESEKGKSTQAAPVAPTPDEPLPLPPPAPAPTSVAKPEIAEPVVVRSEPVEEAKGAAPANEAIPKPTLPPSLQGDSIIVEQSLVLDLDPTAEVRYDPAPPAESQQSQQQQSQQSQQSNGSVDAYAGAETQALLSDFARMEAIAQAIKLNGARSADILEPTVETSTQAAMHSAAAQTATQVEPQIAQVQQVDIQGADPAHDVEMAAPAEIVQPIPAESSTQARAASRPRSRSPHPHSRGQTDHHSPPPAKRPRHTEPSHPSERARAHTPRSTARAPRISQAADGSGRQHISVPVRLNFNVVGVTQSGSTEEESEAEIQMPRRHYRASVNGNGNGNGEFATPRSHRELLQTHIGSASAAGSGSRRQSRRSHASTRQAFSPDTIYASPAIPPAIVRPPRTASPSLPGPSSRRRSSSTPPIRDRHAAILDGQAIAARHAELYKANIRKLTLKYGATPTQVYKALDSTKEPGEVKLPWDEIERRLDGYYQYSG